MILLIDNFDSFTFNLYQALCLLKLNVKVVRNNILSSEECLNLAPKAIVIGPGPGTPDDGGVSLKLLEDCNGKIPILGICLGHQCIGQFYGGSVIRALRPVHGKISVIQHSNQGLFHKIPQHFLATRYHSLIVEKESLPGCLEVTAVSDQGEIMGLKHRHYPIEGIQFHPESVQTENGLQLLQNFFLTIGVENVN